MSSSLPLFSLETLPLLLWALILLPWTSGNSRAQDPTPDSPQNHIMCRMEGLIRGANSEIYTWEDWNWISSVWITEGAELFIPGHNLISFRQQTFIEHLLYSRKDSGSPDIEVDQAWSLQAYILIAGMENKQIKRHISKIGGWGEGVAILNTVVSKDLSSGMVCEQRSDMI